MLRLNGGDFLSRGPFEIGIFVLEELVSQGGDLLHQSHLLVPQLLNRGDAQERLNLLLQLAVGRRD